jgi:hypothetical protein
VNYIRTHLTGQYKDQFYILNTIGMNNEAIAEYWDISTTPASLPQLRIARWVVARHFGVRAI